MNVDKRDGVFCPPALSVGIRLHDMAEAPLEERLRMAGEQGFTCVHLASKVVYAAYGIDRTGLTPGLAAHLRHTCERAGVDIAVFGCYRNLATPSESHLEHELAEYEACCRFASWLGGCVVGTETGRPNVENRKTPELHTAGALALFERGLVRAVRHAERWGVSLVIEPGFGEVVHTPSRCRHVLDAVDSPALGVLYDPVAQLHAGNVDRAQDVVAEMLERCGDEILVLHAKDYEVVAGAVVCHGAGETGAFDYAPIAAWARERKPGIQCVVENSTPATAISCRNYLRSL